MPKRILIIDDDQLVIKSLSRYLKSRGYEVTTAENGEEALKEVDSANFDLIISDIRMPGMNGIETLRNIRKLQETKSAGKKPPAIVITGYSGDDPTSESSKLGIVNHLYKPFELDEFMKIVKQSMDVTPEYEKTQPHEEEIIDKGFIELVEEMQNFLRATKDRFDTFDKDDNDEAKQASFIEINKEAIFEKLDYFFDKSWGAVENLDNERLTIYQKYYQKKLLGLLEETLEVNKHIFRKPLGYAGDFITMNYILDYHSSYLGNSSYEKLMNRYTCNIPISISNIKRRDYFKEKIFEVIQGKNSARILSLGSGPARELLGLLKESKISVPLDFKCLDLEQNALNYVKEEMEKIEPSKKQHLKIEYIHRDIVSIIRDKRLRDEINGQDMIYASGLFDYLSDKAASMLIRNFYKMLNKGSSLIVCNASIDRSSHRAYYELLGDWKLNYRKKEEMLRWTEKIDGDSEIKFEEFTPPSNYLFLHIKKL